MKYFFDLFFNPFADFGDISDNDAYICKLTEQIKKVEAATAIAEAKCLAALSNLLIVELNKVDEVSD